MLCDMCRDSVLALTSVQVAPTASVLICGDCNRAVAPRIELRKTRITLEQKGLRRTQ